MSGRLVATDLDGTLLDNNSKMSEMNLSALKALEQKKVLRVIATGRSLYSAKRVLDPDLPIDYLVFSSGAGIVEWKTGEIIYERCIDNKSVEYIIELLKSENLSFMVHNTIPDNHHFMYHEGNSGNTDFYKRISVYNGYGNSLNGQKWVGNAAQFVAIVENPDISYHIGDLLPDMNVIRTTSPLNGESTWIEIFPKDVSKATGIDFIAKKYNISINNIISVGNDYNDIDMLDYAGTSYVVENAPPDLREKYLVIPSNTNDGFARLMGNVFDFF